MKRIATKKVLKKMMIALAVLTLSACGGGGGSNSPVGPSYAADFTADSAGSSPSVSLAKKSDSGSIVYVDITVDGAVNLFGADVEMTIDSSKVALGGDCTAGSLLSGASVYCTQSGDEITIGISLQSPASPVSGSGVIATVPLRITAAGMSTVSFSVSKLYDNNAPTPAEVTVNSWTGGTIIGL